MASSIAILCFICGFVAAVPIIDERIIGGKDAPDGAFPYVVSLRYDDNEHIGTGTIISDSWILSVAQTVAMKPAALVVAGTTKLSEKGTAYKVSKTVVHPDYTDGEFPNDIALIQIDGKISFGPNVKAVQLPSAPPANGTAVTVAGWGMTNYQDQTVPDKLQFINVTILDDAECRHVSNTSICTIGPKGKGMCLGDNGDPVVSNDVVFGMAAWLNPCANGKPDGHTNVALYIDWIKNVTGI